MGDVASFLPHTEQVIKMFRRASPHDRTLIGMAHQHYERELTEARTREDFTPAGLAAGLHEVIDRSIAHTIEHTANGKRVACKRGCAECCRLQVSITQEEAKLLVMFTEYEHIDIDRKRLQRQAEHRGIRQFGTLSRQDRACVFLTSDNECAVYEHRPGACRKYLVADTAKWCDVIKHPDHKVANVMGFDAEVVFSAALATSDSGPMAVMLLKELVP